MLSNYKIIHSVFIQFIHKFTYVDISGMSSFAVLNVQIGRGYIANGGLLVDIIIETQYRD